MKKRLQNKELTHYAKQMRLNMEDAEYKLWYHLRNKHFCGIRFNRQAIIGNYIVDFVCRKQKIIIELDGEQHAMQQKYDEKRTQYLNARGYKVIRFWNDEVLKNMDSVLDAIYLALREIDPEALDKM